MRSPPLSGLILENKGMRAVELKKGKRSSKRTQLWIFATDFFKIRASISLHPPKQHVFLEFLIENKEFYSTKRALRGDTARNMWLK